MTSCDTHVTQGTEILGQFWKNFRQIISKVLGVKLRNLDHSRSTWGSMFGFSKIPPLLGRLCRPWQNSDFRGPQSLGTENEKAWELSSQTLSMQSQYTILSAYTIGSSSATSIRVKRAHPLESASFWRTFCFLMTLGHAPK